jgi:RNA polymerase sigma factor (sigma-70 family)
MTSATSATTDADVIAASVDWPDGFAVVFDRHYRKIYAYVARRLGDGLAEDVAAETFLIAFDRRHAYDRQRLDAGPWLFGIAANLIARHTRAEARRLRALSRVRLREATDADGDVVADRLDAAAVRGRLAKAVAGLPATERDVLLLVAWADLTCHDAAEALGIPPGTARSRLHRARNRIRVVLDLDAISDQEGPQ